MSRRTSGETRGVQLLDQPFDGLRLVQVPQGAEGALAMRTVDRLQAGVDRPEVDQGPQRQMGQDPVRVGLVLHRPASSASANLAGAQ